MIWLNYMNLKHNKISCYKQNLNQILLKKLKILFNKKKKIILNNFQNYKIVLGKILINNLKFKNNNKIIN